MIVVNLANSIVATLQPKEIQFLHCRKYDVLKKFLYDFYWITRVPMISVLVLIIGLIRIASMSLANLCKEISFRESASSSEMNLLIMKWRKSYILVRDLVAELNACFGQHIIIVVFMAMLSSINLIFAVIVKISINNLSYMSAYVLEIATSIICLSLLAFISEQIPQQVSYAI